MLHSSVPSHEARWTPQHDAGSRDSLKSITRHVDETKRLSFNLKRDTNGIREVDRCPDQSLASRRKRLDALPPTAEPVRG